jgi:hypothetical protein
MRICQMFNPEQELDPTKFMDLVAEAYQRSGGEGWLYISGTVNMLYCLDIAVYLVVSLSLSLNGTFTFYF